MEYKYRRPWFSNVGVVVGIGLVQISQTMVLKRWGCGRDRWSTNIVDHVPQPLRHAAKEQKGEEDRQSVTSNTSSSIHSDIF